ncbi:hypothetical protein JYU34_021448 [Plutella xylostella]|uniref:Uncharacterized protein n=1 Tax=Plutella xylostella TaxID=51655 RepID=A0ABQ7PTV6_PLUXY|nr:hypothetical protein JYU34_021448 [Plutella xylostella]
MDVLVNEGGESQASSSRDDRGECSAAAPRPGAPAAAAAAAAAAGSSAPPSPPPARQQPDQASEPALLDTPRSPQPQPQDGNESHDDRRYPIRSTRNLNIKYKL